MNVSDQRRESDRRFFALGVFFLAAASVLVVSEGSRFDLLAHPFAFLVISLTMGLILSCVVLLLSIGTCISEELIYLAAETSREAASSPEDLIEAIQSFEYLFNFYDETLKRRPLSPVLSRLFMVRSQLQWAKSQLTEPLSDASAEPIRKIGNRLAKFCARFHEWRFGCLYHSTANFVEDDVKGVATAEELMREFHRAVEDLLEIPTFKKANRACLLSRRAGAVIHCIWSEYSRTRSAENETLLQFRADLERAFSATQNLAKKSIQNESISLHEYANSLERRLQAFDALRTGNRKLLWEILCDAVPNVVAGQPH